MGKKTNALPDSGKPLHSRLVAMVRAVALPTANDFRSAIF